MNPPKRYLRIVGERRGIRKQARTAEPISMFITWPREAAQISSKMIRCFAMAGLVPAIHAFLLKHS
jgi:hypothetical protein